MKKFFDSDWLRAVQFQGDTVQKKGNTVICTELPNSAFGTALLSSCIYARTMNNISKFDRQKVGVWERRKHLTRRLPFLK